MYSCPHCHKEVKNLKKHLKRMHPDQVSRESPAQGTKTKAKTLELDIKTKEKKEKVEESGYHCVDCGGALTKGQTPCPGCGATLDWRGL